MKSFWPVCSLGLITRSVWLSCLLCLPAVSQIAQQGNKLSGLDAVGKAQQGLSAGISADGNTVILGGPFDSADYGASWIFSRTGGVWSQQGNKLVGSGATGTNAPFQGWSVAISADGNTAIEGAIEDNAEYGSAWVFTRSGGWTQQGSKLSRQSGMAGQGYSVALSADGNTALVGAVGLTDLCCSGAVSVYTRTGGVWTLSDTLAGTGGTALGTSVALSADGNTALLGDPTDSGGAVYVFVRNGATWSRQSKLLATGGIGSSVALSADGNTALLGAPADNGIGAALVFIRTGGVWSTQGSKLVGIGSVGNAAQGASVAISGDGSTAIVCGPADNANTGAAWVFTQMNTVWSQQGIKLVGAGAIGNARQGASVAVSSDGSTVVVGGPNDASGAGAAWIYTVPYNDPMSSFSITQVRVAVPLVVDGLSYEADAGATYNFPCAPGSIHTASVAISLLPSPSQFRYVWGGWSDGTLSANRQITCPARPTAITTIINLQFLLTTIAPPLASISTNPASPDGFYNAGTTVQLTASAGFVSWSGDLSGSANPQSVVMNGTKSVTANFITGPPTVWIDSPANGARVSGPVSVTGWAIDNISGSGTAVTGIQVKVDGVFAGNATYGVSRIDVCNAFPGRPRCPNVGYSFQLNTSSLSPGSHTLTVLATDSDPTPDTGVMSVTITVVGATTTPTTVIDSPSSGSTVSGTVSVSGWAIDNISTIGTAIARVLVEVDGTVVGVATYGVSRTDVCAAWPGRPACPNVGYGYQLNTTTLTPGSHTLTVEATDSDSSPQTGSRSVSITVANAQPPLVYIDSPSPGTVISGMATMSGWALDNGVSVGTAIANVQIKVDGSVVGTATFGSLRPDVCAAYTGRPNCPNVGWTFALDTTKLAPGSHLLSAVATDSDENPDAGLWTEAITVAPASSQPPLVFIDSVATGAVVSGMVTVSGWAVDNGVTVGTAIASVQVKVDGNVVGYASYGSTRPDVCAVYVNRPGCPNVGWAYSLDTTRLALGTHTVTAVATDMDGSPGPDSGTYTLTIQVGRP